MRARRASRAGRFDGLCVNATSETEHFGLAAAMMRAATI